MAKRVAVLYGGWSTEREVSLTSGRGVVEALSGVDGYEIIPIDVQANVAQMLAEIRPDVAFNALHGRYGEDGCIQGLLEILRIPYTHSGVLASAVAMDKPKAKEVFAAAGIPLAKGVSVTRHDLLKGEPLPRPFVVKPVAEGSSVGVSIVKEGDNFLLDEENWQFGETVMVEEYIPGREVQAAVLDGEALGAIEIRPKTLFYDYEAKYTSGKAEHLMPAPINREAYEQILEYAVTAHNALGCRGVTRSDFRYDDTQGGPGRIIILETNTQPGMTPLSLTPEIAAYAGISYRDLVVRLVEGARCGS